MANQIISTTNTTFENLRRTNVAGSDCWSARELGKVLGYAEYRNFLPVLEKAKQACNNSRNNVLDHFVDSHEMVDIGSGARREMPTMVLSRYACYLIVQNADPAKEIVALGQTYFAESRI